MTHKDDLALVELLLKGDEASFKRFYDTYFPRVYRFCLSRMDDKDSSSDIVQQTMSNAMRGLHTYRGEASLLTWLCQIARNEIYGWRKRFGNKAELTSSFDQNPDLLAVVESMQFVGSDSALHDDLSSLVQVALDGLPNGYGTVLELKYIEGLSVVEIAEKMAVTEIAIQSLLARARRAFKQAFTELEMEYSAT